MTTDTEAELELVVRELFERFARGDIDGMEQLLSPDCTLWDLSTPQLIVGPAERRAFHADDREQAQARGRFSWDLDVKRVEVWGDTALVCYTFDFAYEPPHPASASVRITNVLRRVDRRWLIVHHHEGEVPVPEQSPLAPPPQ